MIDRPNGSGDYVIVHFLEPVYLDRAKTVWAPPNSCIFLRPNSSTYIEPDGAAIYNNFVHLPPDLVEGTPHYPLRHDELFLLMESGFLTPLLRRIQQDIRREWLEGGHYWEEAIRLRISELFLELARNASSSGAEAPSGRSEVIRQVRLKVHSEPHRSWTVEQMARMAELSPSYFSALYRELFGRAPVDDLIRRRIEVAKFYLTDPEMQVSEVAESAGFTNPYYFSRCFRRHVGCPPSEYQRISLPPNASDDTARRISS